MGVEFDPAWEYWEPDPEVSEAMGGGRAAGLDGLPRGECPRTGRPTLDGFRVGRGDPDRPPHLRLAPPRCERPDRLPLRRCKGCPRLFTPDHAGRVYCCRECRGDAVRLPARPCRRCGREFRPCNRTRRYCSASCSSAAASAARSGVPVRVDWRRVAALFSAGAKVTAVARAVGCCPAAVRHALRVSGVYERRADGPARTVPDAVCRNPECGATFRPRQRDQAAYCSRACFHASDRLPPKGCVACGLTFTPKRSKAKYCGYKCSGPAAGGAGRIDAAEVMRLRAEGLTPAEIAGRIGRAAVSVRAVIRAYRARTA
jgi:transposase-like protein